MFFSSNTPVVAAVIPAMDAIDEAFASGIIDKQPPSNPIRHALSIGKKTLNKYYSLTDNSDIYCMAMSKYNTFFISICILTIFSPPSLPETHLLLQCWLDGWMDK